MRVRKTEMKIMITLLVIAIGSGGCQSLSRIHYRAGVIPVHKIDHSRIILAADFGDVPQDKTTQPAKKSSTDEKTQGPLEGGRSGFRSGRNLRQSESHPALP